MADPSDTRLAAPHECCVARIEINGKWWYKPRNSVGCKSFKCVRESTVTNQPDGVAAGEEPNKSSTSQSGTNTNPCRYHIERVELSRHHAQHVRIQSYVRQARILFDSTNVIFVPASKDSWGSPFRDGYCVGIRFGLLFLSHETLSRGDFSPLDERSSGLLPQ